MTDRAGGSDLPVQATAATLQIILARANSEKTEQAAFVMTHICIRMAIRAREQAIRRRGLWLS